MCGNQTRDRTREDTIMKNYPLYYPKCKKETRIDVKDLQITVIKELDA
ncbi:MAG: cysteine-rich KTR domain-containing protein [Lachnospiraceae bacterium]|nr:cysteine-rich KTR domain-containing protein [Lachnospiraceae bacterium]